MIFLTEGINYTKEELIIAIFFSYVENTAFEKYEFCGQEAFG